MSVLKALAYWREQDHEDNIKLSRHEVCTLLDEVKRLRAENAKLRAALEQIIKMDRSDGMFGRVARRALTHNVEAKPKRDDSDWDHRTVNTPLDFFAPRK